MCRLLSVLCLVLAFPAVLESAEQDRSIAKDRALIAEIVKVLPEAQVSSAVFAENAKMDPSKVEALDLLTAGLVWTEKAKALLIKHFANYPFMPCERVSNEVFEANEFCDFTGVIFIEPKASEEIQYYVSLNFGDTVKISKVRRPPNERISPPNASFKSRPKVTKIHETGYFLWFDSERLIVDAGRALIER